MMKIKTENKKRIIVTLWEKSTIGDTIYSFVQMF